MSQSDEIPQGWDQQPPGHDSTYPQGNAMPPPTWRERSAFHVSVDYTTGANRELVWQTRAYHEESDTRSVWPGVPGDALIGWLIAMAELPAGAAAEQYEDAVTHEASPQPAEAPQHAAPPAASQPADDFKQIIGIRADMEQQLYDAGIRTYAQLASCTAAELGALLDVSPERVTRRGWITRARRLAKAAEQSSEQSSEQPEQLATANGLEQASAAARAGATLHIQVLFDEDGEVLDQRVLHDDLPPALPSGQQGVRVAHLFVEQSLLPAEPAEAVASPPMPAELLIDLAPLYLEELPGATVPRLRARSTFSLSGIGHERLLAGQPGYIAYVLGHDLASGMTKVLQSVSGQLSPTPRDEPLEAEFDVPEIGHYRMLLAVLLADHTTVSVAAGPRLRVDP